MAKETIEVKQKEKTINDFLKDEVVFIKPIIRHGKMGITDPKHIACFKMEGSSDGYTIKYEGLPGGGLKVVNPFSNDEERIAFEQAIGTNLNVNDKNCEYWKQYVYSITKTPQLMNLGIKLYLNEINDAIAYRVLKTWTREFAPDWDSRNDKTSYKYAFVTADYKEKKDSSSLDEAIEIGKIVEDLTKSTSRLRNFINIYYQSKNKFIEMQPDSTEHQLKSELKKIIDIDKNKVIEIMNDKQIYNLRDLINTCLNKGIISRRGAASYEIPGLDGVTYTYKELVDQLKKWDNNGNPTETLYIKLLALAKKDE